MEEGGKMLGRILSQLLKDAKPGVVLQDLETMAQDLIAKTGGTPSFQTVKGYRWATCLCINDVVVHGVPSGYKLNRGDVLTIDIGLIYKGLHTDMARTFAVGKVSAGAQKIIAVAEQSFWEGIKNLAEGQKLSNYSQAVQNYVEKNGFSVVRNLVGHGVGYAVHESPRIPNYFDPALSKIEIKEGMVLAIEPMIALGTWKITEGDDGFSIKTADGSWAAHISDYDSGRYNADWQKRLLSKWAIQKTGLEAEKHGYKWSVDYQNADGKQYAYVTVSR